MLRATVRQSQPPFRFKVTPTKNGQPVPIEPDTMEYSSTDPAVLTVAEDPNNEQQGEVSITGLGVAKFQSRFDADQGSGVNEVLVEVEVTVIPDDADGANVEFTGVTIVDQ